jgi:hypothetical protein
MHFQSKRGTLGKGLQHFPSFLIHQAPKTRREILHICFVSCCNFYDSEDKIRLMSDCRAAVDAFPIPRFSLKFQLKKSPKEVENLHIRRAQ